MSVNGAPGKCPMCGGGMKGGKTTFTAELGFGVVVVRDVPATICDQCGADWIADKSTQEIEKIVAEARRKHSLIEVTKLSA